MDSDSQIRLKFWGVRGSVPVPKQGYLRCGGNTTCIEIRYRDTLIIIDAGTGIRLLGATLQAEDADGIHILMTHFHWDHIQGLPFFAPLYSPHAKISFYSSRPVQELRAALRGEMSPPYFPVGFDALPARIDLVEFAGTSLQLSGVAIHPFPLNHPQGAVGYRIEAAGKVITHACDSEHGNPQLDTVLRKYSQNSDLLIYDAQYTPEEYEAKKGWGHSTWLEATRVARTCEVGRLMLFHHDPEHDDTTMEGIVTQARQHFNNTDIAREQEEIFL